MLDAQHVPEKGVVSDRERALEGLHAGVRQGWWQDVDEEALLPIRVFRRDAFHDHATWGHVWMSLGRFPSMKEAKRAGWGGRLTCETKRLGTFIVRIEGE